MAGKWSIFQRQPSSGQAARQAQPIFAGAICCMLVGEAWVDEQTGDERRHLCGAVATTAWHITETLDGASVTVGVPLCAEHAEAYRAAAAPNGVTQREVYPVGTFARWQEEANAQAQEQTQEVVDTLLAAVKERLYDDLHVSEAQVARIWQACDVALHTRDQRILRVDASPARPKKRKASVGGSLGDGSGKATATQPVRLV